MAVDAAALLPDIAAAAADFAALRRDLHAHPELGFEGTCLLHNPSYDFGDRLLPLGAS